MDKISDIGARIKEYRTTENITLLDIEKLTGVRAQTLNRYELGQRSPKIDVALDIADKLKINPLWLLGYDVDMAPIGAKEALIDHILFGVSQLTPQNQERLADYLTLLLQSQQ